MILKGTVRVGNSKNSKVGTDIFLNKMVKPTRFTRDREYSSLQPKTGLQIPVLQDYLNLEIRFNFKCVQQKWYTIEKNTSITETEILSSAVIQSDMSTQLWRFKCFYLIT